MQQSGWSKPLQSIIEPPNEGEQPEGGWPLIVFLHGTTERGSALKKLWRRGPLAYRADGGRFRCYVAAPQCPATTTWNHLNEALEQWLDALLLQTHAIDPNRITLTGFSLGGFGTLDWAYRSPERFAALSPVAGVAVPDSNLNPCAYASIPMWIFAGRKDTVVPASGAEAFITLMKSCGTQPRYTLYDTNHVETGKRAYRNPELYHWMLSQRRGQL